MEKVKTMKLNDLKNIPTTVCSHLQQAMFYVS
jgi:hypothetical protein